MTAYSSLVNEEANARPIGQGTCPRLQNILKC